MFKKLPTHNMANTKIDKKIKNVLKWGFVENGEHII